MSMTTFRQGVAAVLATATGITFKDGRIIGPVDTGDIGCTYPVDKAEMGGNVDVEEITIRARILKQWQGQLDPTVPVDPAPLEELAETIQSALTGSQTTLGPWFCRVVRVDFDLDSWAVDALVVGWAYNLLEQV